MVIVEHKTGMMFINTSANRIATYNFSRMLEIVEDNDDLYLYTI